MLKNKTSKRVLATLIAAIMIFSVMSISVAASGSIDTGWRPIPNSGEEIWVMNPFGGNFRVTSSFSASNNTARAHLYSMTHIGMRRTPQGTVLSNGQTRTFSLGPPPAGSSWVWIVRAPAGSQYWLSFQWRP